LDWMLIQKLSTVTKLPITFTELADISSSPAGLVPVLSEENPLSIKPVDSNTLAGYFLLSDVYGKPYLVVGTQTPREIYTQGRRTVLLLLLSIIVVGGLITLIVILFLNRTVFSRIKSLSNYAAGISKDVDFSPGAILKGDELSILSIEINAMISRLSTINSRLVESENKYSTLVEKSSDGIVLILDEKVIYANPKMLQMLGLQKDKLLGRSFLNFIHPKHREKVSNLYTARLNGLTREESYEIEINGKNETVIPVEVRSKMIKLNDQDCDMVIFRDITERKSMEEKILDLYEKEKSHRQELEEEARQKSLFIDILAHELRNPLSPIISSSELLQELTQSNSNEMQKKLVTNIRNGSNKLARKLEELLDMARYSRGTFTLNRQAVEIKSNLEDIISRFRPTIEKRNQQLVVEIAEDMPVVLADNSRLEQVLVNLLSNASKFSPEKSKIYIKAFVNGGSLEVSVKDEGTGISPDDQKKLFQPYFRVQNDRSKVSGLGLGLAVCQKIIEAHGGEIWVTSQLGQGSTFSFRIPIS
jgi:PAS domain S-box-containing protein